MAQDSSTVFPASAVYSLNSDSELNEVAEALLMMDPLGSRTAKAIRRTFDMLLDGQNTGRYRWEQLHKTEKTHCGTLVEINLQREFDFADGTKMDYSICGVDVDCKYSQDFGKWMIPPEAVGHLCLGLWASDRDGKWSAGIFRAAEEALTPPSKQRDKKRTMTAAARDTRVRWLFRDEPLPENLLLQMDEQSVAAIFAETSGAKRVDELFRRAQGRIVTRTAVATVGQQDDPMKRVRGNGGSRSALRPEGIVIFGQYSAHGTLAAQLGLPVPLKGQSLSVKLTPASPSHGNAPRIRLEGTEWVVATSSDPVVNAPELPSTRANGNLKS